jgi:hypothetical protein
MDNAWCCTSCKALRRIVGCLWKSILEAELNILPSQAIISNILRDIPELSDTLLPYSFYRHLEQGGIIQDFLILLSES